MADRRAVLAEVDGGRLLDIGDRRRERVRRHRLASRRHRDLQIAEVDAGVARRKNLEHGRRHETERNEFAILLEQMDRVRGAGVDRIEGAGEPRILVRLIALGGLLLKMSSPKNSWPPKRFAADSW